MIATYSGSGVYGAGSAQEYPNRAALVNGALIEEGYNTNYGASWFLTRGGLKFSYVKSSLVQQMRFNSTKAACTDSVAVWSPSATTGPITQRTIDNSRASSSAIPLIGDVKPTGLLSADISPEIPAGQDVAARRFGGPAHWGTGAKVFIANNTQSPATVWYEETAQDYTRLWPLHNRSCNIAMADGSVRSYYDKNGDTYLKNFDATGGFPSGVAPFADDEQEVVMTELMSFFGVSEYRAK